jgi:hypothetical protein
VTLQKQIPLRHKQEIVVIQGFELLEEKRRTYKKLLKQVNQTGVASKAVAIRKLALGNIMLTIEDKQACTS